MDTIKVNIPASKSISNRALIIQAIQPKVVIENLSEAQDTIDLQQNLKQLSKGREFHIGEGGTSLRFFLALAACRRENIYVTGTSRLNQRPLQPLLEALESLGAVFEYHQSTYHPPLTIKKRVDLTRRRVTVSTAESSQFLSALLLVAPLFHQGITFCLDGQMVSESYLNLTISLLEYFGVSYSWKENEITVFKDQLYQPKSIYIENDWSSASYWWLAAVLSGKKVTINNLSLKTRQADVKVVEYIKDFVDVKQESNHLCIIPKKQESNRKKTYFFDCLHCPDLVPLLAVFCAIKGVEAMISGVSTLYVKESNRIEALKNELEKINTRLIVKDRNNIMIKPGALKEFSGMINTYSDHRIAMVFALLKIVFPQLKIEHPEVVRKSYPGFWDELDKFLVIDGR